MNGPAKKAFREIGQILQTISKTWEIIIGTGPVPQKIFLQHMEANRKLVEKTEDSQFKTKWFELLPEDARRDLQAYVDEAKRFIAHMKEYKKEAMKIDAQNYVAQNPGVLSLYGTLEQNHKKGNLTENQTAVLMAIKEARSKRSELSPK